MPRLHVLLFFFYFFFFSSYFCTTKEWNNEHMYALGTFRETFLSRSPQPSKISMRKYGPQWHLCSYSRIHMDWGRSGKLRVCSSKQTSPSVLTGYPTLYSARPANGLNQTNMGKKMKLTSKNNTFYVTWRKGSCNGSVLYLNVTDLPLPPSLQIVEDVYAWINKLMSGPGASIISMSDVCIWSIVSS